MTLTQLEKRVNALEQTVQHLTQSKPVIRRDWYRTHAGRFADDPAFHEIVRLGRACRESQS
jgi:hypothetical protein